jgi:hypothetical protein
MEYEKKKKKKGKGRIKMPKIRSDERKEEKNK